MSVGQFGFFIRIPEIAISQLKVLFDSRGQQVLNTIKHFNAGWILTHVPQLAIPNEPKPVTEGPTVAESQLQTLMNLLEQEAITEPVFAQITRYRGIGFDSLCKWLPGCKSPVCQLFSNDSLCPCAGGMVDYFVRRVIRKQSGVRIFPPSRQGSMTGNEHPMITRTYRTHEKLWHQVNTSDPIPRLIFDENVAIRNWFRWLIGF
jgi:hypothetical protein